MKSDQINQKMSLPLLRSLPGRRLLLSELWPGEVLRHSRAAELQE